MPAGFKHARYVCKSEPKCLSYGSQKKKNVQEFGAESRGMHELSVRGRGRTHLSLAAINFKIFFLFSPLIFPVSPTICHTNFCSNWHGNPTEKKLPSVLLNVSFSLKFTFEMTPCHSMSAKHIKKGKMPVCSSYKRKTPLMDFKVVSETTKSKFYLETELLTLQTYSNEKYLCLLCD